MNRTTLTVMAMIISSANVNGAGPDAVDTQAQAALFPLSSVRLLDGPFLRAAGVNRAYLLALEPDRLLAPFLREAGLPRKAEPYGNWESGGLDGHTAGHYVSGLADMIAAGHDTDGELRRRLDYMLDEMERCQEANGNGYIGGVPGSRAFWDEIAAGRVRAVRSKWVPWYNVHKTFAGLCDAYRETGAAGARDLLVGLGDWCIEVTSGLSDEQMQRMIDTEYGGMNEAMADIYAITGDEKYLEAARRFNHLALLDPLKRGEDRLTGLHANTQIPKVVGFERIALLTGDASLDAAARYFWETVTESRSVAFGGNSVSEHFNPPGDFRRMIEHREGPETCNTYNMLRLSALLFAWKPAAAYADFYERALFNHILSAIHPEIPGYVYFTPVRPRHYRVYSQPEHCFWCCVGTGMENPGKYGAFIYGHAGDDVYVNLFISSVVEVRDGVRLRQETRFPHQPRTRLRLDLAKPSSFTLRIRHPAWVPEGGFAVKVNGKPVPVDSAPSSYAALAREWRDGDTVEVELPMQTTVERLPDGSDWIAFLHGPIALVSPSGTNDLVGLRADDARMGHVAHGPMVPLDRVPALLGTAEELPGHVVPDPDTGPLHFRLVDVVEPPVPEGLPLVPFFALHDARYQMYWELTTREKLAGHREELAAEERARAAREAATLDWIGIGEQQPEVEHDFAGEGVETGVNEGRRWRHGAWFQYTLDPRGEKAADLAVTYWGGDSGRTFDILVNGTRVATEQLEGEQPGAFIEKSYPIPPELLQASPDGRVTVKFVATRWLAGGIYDLRLLKPDAE